MQTFVILRLFQGGPVGAFFYIFCIFAHHFCVTQSEEEQRTTTVFRQLCTLVSHTGTQNWDLKNAKVLASVDFTGSLHTDMWRDTES